MISSPSSIQALCAAFALTTFVPDVAFADGVRAHNGAHRPRVIGAVHSHQPPAALQTLEAANEAARQRPNSSRFQSARQIYAYAPGSLYQIDASPNFVSAILLEPGETLIDIAAGDTSRWLVTQASAETSTEGRTIVLIKSQAENLRTNIVLITDRRTYLIEAVSHTGSTYSAEVAWSYPQTQSVTPNAEAAPLFTDYRIRTLHGARPAWAPTRVGDDGRHTWIDFAPAVVASDLPPLFVITPEGAELVNYRVEGQRYVVDRVFDVAELRLGLRAPIVVRIERRATAHSGRGRPQ